LIQKNRASYKLSKLKIIITFAKKFK